MHVRRIRIIKHEAVPQCGSFKIPNSRTDPANIFYWDDLPSRRLRPETLDRETALEKAKAVARAASGSPRNDPHLKSKRAAFARPLMKKVRNENRAGKMATYSFPQAGISVRTRSLGPTHEVSGRHTPANKTAPAHAEPEPPTTGFSCGPRLRNDPEAANLLRSGIIVPRNKGRRKKSYMGFRVQPPKPSGRKGGPSSSQPAGAVSHLNMQKPASVTTGGPRFREQSSELIAQHCAWLADTIGAIWSDGDLPLEQRDDHQCGD